MALPVYPALSKKPQLRTPTELQDPALKNEATNGMPLTRPRYTRIRRKWNITYPALPDSELTTLLVFYESVLGGSAIFLWSDEFNNTYSVRFISNIKHNSVSSDHSTVSFDVREA